MVFVPGPEAAANPLPAPYLFSREPLEPHGKEQRVREWAAHLGPQEPQADPPAHTWLWAGCY